MSLLRRSIPVSLHEGIELDARLKSLAERGRTLNVHNLIQEIGWGVSPYNSQRPNGKEAGFTLQPELEVNNAIAGSLFTELLGSRHYSVRRELGAIVRKCAERVALFEEMLLELAEDTREGRLRLFELNPGSAYLSFGSWVQKLPKSVADAHGYPLIHPLDGNRIVRIALPPWETKLMRNCLDDLASIDREPKHEKVYNAVSSSQKQGVFDVKTYSQGEDLALAHATRAVGWDPFRGMGRPETSEFYWQYRELLFLTFLSKLRWAVVEGLNRVFDIVYQHTGVRTSVVAYGFPSTEEIANCRSQLIEGTRPWSEITAQLGSTL